jgi:hypothetical protein
LAAEDLEVYHNSMAKVRQEWRTADDYILHKIFGFPDAKEDDGKRFVVLPPQEKETLIFTPNDFPYSKEESIQQVRDSLAFYCRCLFFAFSSVWVAQ